MSESMRSNRHPPSFAPPGAGPSSVFSIEWVSREPPLEPSAALLEGAVAMAWAHRGTNATLPEDLRGVARFSGSGEPPLVVLLGPSHALPWVDGVEYYGVDPEASGLFLPTARRPSVPVALFARAVRDARPPGPYLFRPGSTSLVVGLMEARPVSLDRLQAFRSSP